MMRCVLCKHGDTRPGTSTVTLERGNSIVILRSVPSEICENCGEFYLSSDIAKQTLKIAEKAVANGAEVEILQFAA